MVRIHCERMLQFKIVRSLQSLLIEGRPDDIASVDCERSGMVVSWQFVWCCPDSDGFSVECSQQLPSWQLPASVMVVFVIFGREGWFCGQELFLRSQLLWSLPLYFSIEFVNMRDFCRFLCRLPVLEVEPTFTLFTNWP